jgi:hypothetical protein
MPKRRLKDSADIRRYLASLITRTETGELEAAQAKSLTYMTSILWRVMAEGELEQRVAALEKLFKEVPK